MGLLYGTVMPRGNDGSEIAGRWRPVMPGGLLAMEIAGHFWSVYALRDNKNGEPPGIESL